MTIEPSLPLPALAPPAAVDAVVGLPPSPADSFLALLFQPPGATPARPSGNSPPQIAEPGAALQTAAETAAEVSAEGLLELLTGISGLPDTPAEPPAAGSETPPEPAHCAAPAVDPADLVMNAPMVMTAMTSMTTLITATAPRLEPTTRRTEPPLAGRAESRLPGLSLAGTPEAPLAESRPALQAILSTPTNLAPLPATPESPPRLHLEAIALPSPAPAARLEVPVPSATVPLPVAMDADFGQHFNSQVIWQISQGIEEAHLQLNPRELGPVDVQVRLSGDEARLSFTAEQPQVRAAVQAALPQLGQLLASQGLVLAQADVQSQSRPRALPPSGVARRSEPDEVEFEPLQPRRSRAGLVDQYA